MAPQLEEQDVRKLFRFYGEIAGLEHIDEVSGGSAVINYATPEAAEEAVSMVHLGSIRGKTARCLLMGSVQAIWKTLHSGCRLHLEGIDLAIESQGLEDVFSLFGTVLDCKVQTDAEGKSTGYGFAHFLHKEEAAKALSTLSGMHIGNSTIKVRLAEPKDLELFTGCLYSLTGAVSSVMNESQMGQQWMGGMDMYHHQGWNEQSYDQWDNKNISNYSHMQ